MNDDLWLTEWLDEEQLPDDGFSEEVVMRIEREQRRRRSVLLSVAAVAGSVILGFLLSSDLSWISRLAGDGWQALAVLLGFGLSGALWIDTEPIGAGEA